MKQELQIIIIDDDPIHSRVCSYLVSTLNKEIAIAEFSNAADAFASIKAGYTNKKKSASTAVLLNINMPGMSGWDFLDALRLLNPGKLQGLSVYVMSASLDPADRIKALSYDRVKAFFMKPVTNQIIRGIIADVSVL